MITSNAISVVVRFLQRKNKYTHIIRFLLRLLRLNLQLLVRTSTRNSTQPSLVLKNGRLRLLYAIVRPCAQI